ncbi:hypothetical protein CCH79_00007959 [Gambusia affinis]|uniref:Uncharacterized protein n=1 Tax=Gambusia affinis TaxID=33528 RepID=A0A315W351_GAMAF|nr:hypothetical protein CCH79_00007959 [Gambusia affinis]
MNAKKKGEKERKRTPKGASRRPRRHKENQHIQGWQLLIVEVDFDQFKHALILVLSSTIEAPQAEQEPLPKPESPEIQPKFVKGSKRYGRRSTPEFLEPVSDLSEVNPATEDDLEDNYDSAVPRKREVNS